MNHQSVEHNYQILVTKIHRLFKEAGKKRAVVELSGEADSFVLLCLAVDTLGKECVHGLMMPSPFSTVHSVTDSVKLAEQVDISYHIIPIDSIYHKFLKELTPTFGNSASEITRNHLQAHIRSALLMAYANQKECILLDTTLITSEGMEETQVYELIKLINKETIRIPLWR